MNGVPTHPTLVSKRLSNSSPPETISIEDGTQLIALGIQLDAGLGTPPDPQAVSATAMMGDSQDHRRDPAMAASTVAAITMR
eukprot:2032380-Rhodomonas_salina.1